MQSLLLLLVVFTPLFLTDAAILKSSMSNNYPQVAVLGCDSRKVNLYYDVDRRVWVEHLISSCVNNEESILKFCQQAYPSLHIGNIVRLDTALRFENWCELISPIDENSNNIPRCKKTVGIEEIVQPFRCLYMNNAREEMTLPALDCSMNSIIGTGECLRAEKWQQLASMECANKSMALNNSIMTLDWCGLSAFRGIEFVCCPTKKISENDYETSLDEDDDTTLDEDDSVSEPDTSQRRLIAVSFASREPSWMEEYRRWNTDPAYFADDEDSNDNQPLTASASAEQIRFSKEKVDFKQKYKRQIDQLRSRWQKRQNEIQSLFKRNASEAQRQYDLTDIEFRQEYNLIKQSANRERTQINEIHETHLDTALNAEKSQAFAKLIQAWNEQPLKTENIQENLYNYLQILLRDRIHLVNRYERLRAVDAEQAERQRVSIHNRLRLIVDRINDALNQLRRYSNLRAKIQPRIDSLFAEFDEVNQAAEKLLTAYAATSSTTTTTQKTRLAPLGRDEKKIYPFPASSFTNPEDGNNEYDYVSNDEYDGDEDDDDFEKKSTTSSTTTVSTSSDTDLMNDEQIETGDSDWDNRDDDDDENDDDVKLDPTIDITIDEQNQHAFINDNDLRTLMPNKRIVRHYFVTSLPYAVGCLSVLCLIIGVVIFRFIKQNRSYGNKYEKNYVFTEVDSCTPEEKALHALQMNGYENPTYKFFESQTGKC